MKNNDCCDYEFWLDALFLMGLFSAAYYFLLIFLHPLVLLFLGVASIVPLFFYPKLERKKFISSVEAYPGPEPKTIVSSIASFLEFAGPFLLLMGIACIWGGFLKGLPK
jgi:hypothetical protein